MFLILVIEKDGNMYFQLPVKLKDVEKKQAMVVDVSNLERFIRKVWLVFLQNGKIPMESQEKMAQ